MAFIEAFEKVAGPIGREINRIVKNKSLRQKLRDQTADSIKYTRKNLKSGKWPEKDALMGLGNVKSKGGKTVYHTGGLVPRTGTVKAWGRPIVKKNKTPKETN